MKCNIYFIAPFPPPVTGAATMANELAETLAQSENTQVDRLNISMAKLSGSFGQYVHKSLKLLGASVKIMIGQYDYLVVVPPGGPMLALYFPVIAAARLRGAKVLFDHHNYSYINAPTKMMACAARLMGTRGVHLFLSEKMGRQFSELYYAKCWKASSNWGRLEFFANERIPASATPLTLGFLSNVSLEKGIDTFLDLLERVIKRGAKVRAIIAGGLDSDAHALIHEAKQRGLPIEAPGALSGIAKAEFLAACDILMLPTRYKNEAEPLVLIEGQLAGCLVIATDVGTIAQTICPGNGFAWPRETFLREAIDLVENVAAEPENLRNGRSRISEVSARRATEERFAWKQCVAELMA